MPENMIVVHQKDRKILKGTTSDFLPTKPVFHFFVGGLLGEERKLIFVDNLKAIFFVKSFEGDKNYDEIKGFGDRLVAGKKVRVTFQDGEVIYGYSHVMNFEQLGFFLMPADPQSNNERIFIVFSSVDELEVDGSLVDLTK